MPTNADVPRGSRVGPPRSGCRGGRTRRGVTLLEVMIAVAVLGIGAVSVIVAVHETTTAAERVRERERTIRDAGRFLEAVALWPVSDLVLRLGERPQGPWRLRIARPSPTLYEITLADSVGRPLLHTAVFRTSDDTTSGGGDAE